MPRYLTLLAFAEQGLREIKHSIQRATDFRKSVEAAGGKIISLYWAIGEADGCIVFEAPSDELAASLLLALAQKGNVRTRTIRVFDAHEFGNILAKV